MPLSEKRDAEWRSKRNAMICTRYREHLGGGATPGDIISGLCHEYGLCPSSVYSILKRGGVKLRKDLR